MPFTPFHLGPGALFKAAGGRHFSFMVFGGSQVLMDIEPLVRILRGDAILHGPTHTLLGALVIGLVAGALGRPISKGVLHILLMDHSELTWRVSFLTAFIGTFSHVAFDAIMHQDMNPFWPFVSGNVMLEVISVGALHVVCLVAGMVGIAVLAARALFFPRED